MKIEVGDTFIFLTFERPDFRGEDGQKPYQRIKAALKKAIKPDELHYDSPNKMWLIFNSPENKSKVEKIQSNMSGKCM